MNDKHNIKIKYQYDGSKFYGFQRQPNIKTVQGTIENQILQSFGEKINLISSGRTDKGVHAIGQVSNFFIKKCINIEIIKKTLNKKIGKEILITDIEIVDNLFHSRYDAKTRTYKYYFKDSKSITPFESNYVSPISLDIDIKKLNTIMQSYIGTHDFINFMKKDKTEKNTVRTIFSINCKTIDDKVEITIKGNSFLKTMVRIMIGTAINVYSGKLREDYIISMLNNTYISEKKYLAPSEGLYLVEVQY